jgi:predicted O-methyltransferase YrrM
MPTAVQATNLPRLPVLALAHVPRPGPEAVARTWNIVSESSWHGTLVTARMAQWTGVLVMLVDASVESVLRDLEDQGRENDAHETDRARKMLNLEREAAELLYVLVHTGRRRRVLEIGTSNGISTIWLAAALRAVGADEPLVSVERDPIKSAQARANLECAGLADRVQLLVGDATDAVASLTGPFDCVFFDADRWSAPRQLHLLLPKLERDCLLLSDNALSHPEEIAGYLAAVDALPDFITTTFNVGKGLHVAHRI